MGKKHKAKRPMTAESKYRPLKKSLKKNYKALVRHVERGELPGRELMNGFMAQSRAMVAYPGFGDSHYEGFTRTCNALQAAFERNDMQLFGEELGKISILKKECHQRYK